ncbi:hypothetical protein H9P43_005786 [Blastocladiella emersonii ATCC 22665]|nr:hypothetical protein H9P43_005786 [Blastocladiella emersonii ATCC 22665]
MAILTQFVRPHVPLIRFLGPRHLLRQAQQAAPAAASPASFSASAAAAPAPAPAAFKPTTSPGATSVVSAAPFGVKRGSVPFSDAEIEAIQLGGAGVLF